ncbi:baculoviral IAP repeat-containing protein 7-A-like [Aphidius gifuensis]|nr:baculoviral IAP repeat-containing protein 7-A-like [Aphidius gifuensis]
MTSSVEDRKRRYNKYIYRVEETRQKSIELSPIADICDPVRFSAAGFYYTGYGSKLKCFECCVEIDEWSRGDNPWLDHQRAKASCRFIRNIACGNVPRGVSPQLIPMEGDPHCIPTDFRASYRVPSTSREEDRTFYAEFYIDLEMEEYSNPPIEEHCVGISTTPPAEKDLVSYESRLNTFYYWPKYISQTKESMAEAGFFYSSIGDYVICHHCGNGIKDWKNNEDPWEEHARYFPECYFLRLIKGNDFVE